jgi:2-amino-4-hydroxy-6-hydroxymethyldihydropteridine diphosphokinase
MNAVYLLIGGNTGDRLHYLESAVEAIEKQCGAIKKVSSIYETAAWGNENQNSFLNQALEVSTKLSAYALLDCILQIEEDTGRIRKEKYGPRIIDIDILLFGDEIIDAGNLKVPHPELPNRRFALQCLNEIAPHKKHPVLNKTISQLLKECNDPLSVDKFR